MRIVVQLEQEASKQQQVKQSKYNFDKKSVKNMEKKASEDRQIGDILYNKANELSEAGEKELSTAAYNHASKSYIESIEKTQKTVLSAQGKEKETFVPDNSKKLQKLITTHSNRALQENLSSNGVELISKEEAARVDLAGGAKRNAFIEVRYKDLNLGKDTCEDLKAISHKAHENLNNLKEKFAKDKVKENALNIVNALISAQK